MLYRIYWSGNPEVHDSRRRADAASLRAQRIAYEVIADRGGLDTAQGRLAMARVQNIRPQVGGSVPMFEAVLYITPSRSTR